MTLTKNIIKTNEVRICTQFMFIAMISLFWLIVGIAFNYVGFNAGIISTIIAICLFLSIDDDQRFLLILSALPFAAIFKITNDIPSSIIILYFMFILHYLVKNQNFPIKSIIYLISFVILQILTIFAYESSSVSIVSFIVNIIFTKICLLDFQKKENKKDFLSNCTLMLVLTLIVDIIVADIFPDIPYIIAFEKQTALESVGRFSALNADPNYYNQLILIGIALLVPLIKHCWTVNKKYKQAIVFSALAIFLFVNGIRSMSKSYVVTFAILIIMVGCYFIFNRMCKKNNPFKTIVVLIFMFVVVFLFIDQIAIPIFDERTLGSVSILTDRDVIWMDYLQGMMNEPMIFFIGSGVSNAAKIIGNGWAAHNVYIELLSELGLFGMVLILNFLNELMSNIKFIFKKTEYLFVWAFLISSFSLSLSSNDALFILLPMMALANE